MISENQHTATTASRVNYPILANATNQVETRNPVIERVMELTAIAQRTFISTFGLQDANLIDNPTSQGNPTTSTTPFQPPLISTPQITQAQRLQIA